MDEDTKKKLDSEGWIRDPEAKEWYNPKKEGLYYSERLGRFHRISMEGLTPEETVKPKPPEDLWEIAKSFCLWMDSHVSDVEGAVKRWAKDGAKVRIESAVRENNIEACLVFLASCASCMIERMADGGVYPGGFESIESRFDFLDLDTRISFFVIGNFSDWDEERGRLLVAWNAVQKQYKAMEAGNNEDAKIGPWAQGVITEYREGESLRYNGKLYTFAGVKRWEIVKSLVMKTNKDGWVTLPKRWRSRFNGDKEAEGFLEHIEANGEGRKGTGNFRIRK